MLAYEEVWVKLNISDKQRKLMGKFGETRPPENPKGNIKEMPIGCLQDYRTRQDHPRTRETPQRGLEKKCQSGVKWHHGRSWKEMPNGCPQENSQGTQRSGLEKKCQTGVHKGSLKGRHEVVLKINECQGSLASPWDTQKNKIREEG